MLQMMSSRMHMQGVRTATVMTRLTLASSPVGTTKLDLLESVEIVEQFDVLQESTGGVGHQLGVARVRNRRHSPRRLWGSDGLDMRPVDTASAQAVVPDGYTIIQCPSKPTPLGDSDHGVSTQPHDVVLYTVIGRTFHSQTRPVRPQNSVPCITRRASEDDDHEPWWRESREGILVRSPARKLAERLAKPTYVNTDGCCRGEWSGLAYESALLGQRMERVFCSDSSLAEHLALLMAMLDADSRLPGRIVFRVDSRAVVGESRDGNPDLTEARRQIEELLNQHIDWSVVLVEPERNEQAHSLARQSLIEDK